MTYEQEGDDKDAYGYDKELQMRRAIIQGKHDFLYNRFSERVKKYQSRGYGVNWIETDVIIPWVKNRFHYAQWLLPQLDE